MLLGLITSTQVLVRMTADECSWENKRKCVRACVVVCRDVCVCVAGQLAGEGGREGCEGGPIKGSHPA